jgi:hypothetical protein
MNLLPTEVTIPPSDIDVAARTSTRTCYVCGRETHRRRIVEPLFLAVCFDGECPTRAAQLPTAHCAIRLADGRLCGAPSTHIQVKARSVCAWHARVALERQYAA